MNIERKTTEKITWDIDLCKAEGEITMENGKILDQTIRIFKDCPEPGDGPGNNFSSNDPQFIRDVHRALGDYIQHLDGIMRGEDARPKNRRTAIGVGALSDPLSAAAVRTSDIRNTDDDHLPDFLK